MKRRGLVLFFTLLAVAQAHGAQQKFLGSLVPNGYSVGSAINRSGTAVGYAQGSNGRTTAFRYNNGVMTDLAPGTQYAFAYSINDAGDAAGIAYTNQDYYQSTIFHADGSTTAPPLPADSYYSYALAINNAGHVAGYYYTRSGHAGAFLSTESGSTVLPPLPGDESVWINALNNSDVAVGYSYGGSCNGNTCSYRYTPVAWYSAQPVALGSGYGTTYGYNADRTHYSQSGTLGFAFGINDAGKIVVRVDSLSYECNISSNQWQCSDNSSFSGLVYAGVQITDHIDNFLPSGINNHDQVAGTSYSRRTLPRAARYSRGVVEAVGGENSWAGFGFPTINDSGTIVGYAVNSNGQTEAVVWGSSSPTSLSLPSAHLAYGNHASLVAKLSAGTEAVSGKLLTFTLDGQPAGSATTDSSGTATLDLDVSARPAGNYAGALGVKFDADATYDASSSSADLVIDQGKPQIDWLSPAPIVYGTTLDGRQLNATVTYNSHPLAGLLSYSAASGSVMSAGTQTLTASFVPDDQVNYVSPVLATVTLNVLKAPLTIRANDHSRLYGAANPILDGVITGLLNGDGITATYASEATDHTDAIKVAITPSLVDPQGRASNYDVTLAAGTLTIDPAPLTITANDSSKVYGATVPAFTASYSGFVLGQDSSVLSGTLSFATAATQASGAGSYAVTPGGLSSTNYAIAFNAGSLAVNRAPLSVTAEGKTKRYGDAMPPLTVSYNGFVLGELETALSGALTFTTSATSASHVGSYSVTPGGLTSANYDISFVANSIGVTTAPLSIVGGTVSYPYGAIGATTVPVSYQGLVLGETESALTGAVQFTSPLAANSEAGDYSVSLSGLSSADYAVHYTDGKITVTRVALTVTAEGKSRLYGGANPSFTSTILNARNGDTFVVSYSTAATEQSNVGNYPIQVQVTGDRLLRNYDLNAVPGILAVLRAPLSVKAADSSKVYGSANPVMSGNIIGIQNSDPILASYASEATAATGVGAYAIVPTLSGPLSNYDVTSTNGSLTITRAPLSVHADNKTKVYGSANPELTGGVTGIQNSDAIVPTYSTEAGAGTGIGAYAIVPSLSGPLSNYEVTFTNGSLSITKAPLSVSADNKSKIYGSANPMLTGTVTGIQNSDAIVATYSTDAVAGTGIGSYTIVPSLTGSLSNYEVTSANGSLSITKAPLNVQAADKSKVYGSANPELTGAVTGIQNGDAVVASFSTEATPLSAVGSYAIVPALSGSLTNYDVTITNGSLTINKAPLAIRADDKSRRYGAGNPTLTGVITGIQNNDAVTGSYATSALPVTGIGTYPIIPTLGGPLSNYEISSTNGTLTISRAPLSIQTDNKAKVYGAANPDLTGVITGIQNDDLVSATYSTTAAQGSDTGNYAIIPTPTGPLSNYDVTTTEGTLTITKANQAVQWSAPASIIYGSALGAAQLNATVTVVGPSPAGAVSYSPTSGTVLLAGSHQALVVSVAGSNNYNPASATVYLDVAKATPSFSAINSATMVTGTASVVLSGKIAAGSLIPPAAETVSISLNGSSQTAAIQADGSFSSTFAISSLAPATPAYTVSYSYPGDANFNAAATTSTLTVTYGSIALFDESAARKSGSTIPIKVSVTNAAGANVSSSSIVVTAVGVKMLSAAAYGPAADAGNSNPDGNFRFTGLDSGAGYIFNFQSTGLSTGTYAMGFKIGNDPTIHTVQFQIR